MMKSEICTRISALLQEQRTACRHAERMRDAARKVRSAKSLGERMDADENHRQVRDAWLLSLDNVRVMRNTLVNDLDYALHGSDSYKCYACGHIHDNCKCFGG